jgi:ABC-type Fe3+-hydroxamate transport system substrate-binding protein
MLKRKFVNHLLATFFLIASIFFPGINWPGGQALSPGALIGSHAQAHENETKARRIVSMAPNITETIFALGGGERLIAVTDFCIYPPEAKELPRVGGYFNPNLERLTALHPDLVIVQGKHDKVDRFCRKKGIPILRSIQEKGVCLSRPLSWFHGKPLHSRRSEFCQRNFADRRR